ncbi:MAG: phosphate signaling complex protein PhoU [Deltaproteobacteria bacterium]|jgi:phosphate transport system protein|nr:phosphate signaling complex protein PhoU [Deltaproteobacteria bacterium]MDA8308310.1 phosphate signaling complex protein PhoU [Deltaproteobacteria bacterium]
METRFNSGLEELQMIILQMAARAEKALEKSTRALLERNDDLAREVLNEDREIDLLELEVDRHSLKLLALGQPMARDLRFIVGTMRIAVELERIGDQAANIARRALSLNSRPPLPRNSAMEELADTALDMLRTVISSFVNQDAEIATDVCKMDDVADELHYRILKDALAYMANEAPAIERSVQTIIATKSLERAADQTTNIAESVIFIVKGVNIKHHCQKREQSKDTGNR